MGGAGYIFTGEHDADIMHNSATINLNVLEACARAGTSQADLLLLVGLHVSGVQPGRSGQSRTARRTPPIRPRPTASTAGRSCSASGSISPTRRNHGIEVRIARYHNIFGPEGTWNGGREKAPAAICRKVARRTTATRSRSGATASRRARSSTSTSASRARCA